MFPKIFLLHKVVRDAKKVEKHSFRGFSYPSVFLIEKFWPENNRLIYSLEEKMLLAFEFGGSNHNKIQ